MTRKPGWEIEMGWNNVFTYLFIKKQCVIYTGYYYQYLASYMYTSFQVQELSPRTEIPCLDRRLSEEWWTLDVEGACDWLTYTHHWLGKGWTKQWPWGQWRLLGSIWLDWWTWPKTHLVQVQWWGMWSLFWLYMWKKSVMRHKCCLM